MSAIQQAEKHLDLCQTRLNRARQNMADFLRSDAASDDTLVAQLNDLLGSMELDVECARVTLLATKKTRAHLVSTPETP